LKVTVKVKHLVLAVLLIGTVGSLLQFVVIPKFQVRAAVEDYERGAPGGKMNLLAAIEDSVSETKRWELIQEYIIGYGSDSLAHSFDVYVGPGSTMSSSPNGDSRHWTWEEKLPYLQEYADRGPDAMSRFSAVNQLARYFVSEGRTNDALALLEKSEELGGAWRAKLILERAELLASLGESEAAMRLIERLEAAAPSTDLDFGGTVAQFKAKLLVGEGKAESAIEVVDREIKALEERVEQLKSEFPEKEDFAPAKLEELTQLREQLRKALNGTGGTVSGTVARSDGTPMARVGVFLRSERDVSHSVMDGEPYQILTDSQGKYEFRNVVPGTYQLFIGLMFDQIDGWTWPTMYDDWIVVGSGEVRSENVTLRPLIKIEQPSNEAELTGSAVKFSWKPVEGAASYTLFGTVPVESGSNSTVIRSGIPQSEIELPFDDLYETAGGYSYRDVDGKFVLDSATLLGFSNPNLRYSWYVEAYDKGGRLITRSNGYRLNEDTMGELPFFYLKGRSLTVADRLMLSGKLDEALAEYTRAYEADRLDRHSLHMIIRIYGAKASINKSYVLQGEAVPYMERMLELTPDKRDLLFQMFDYYEGRREWTRAESYYERYLEAIGGKAEGYTQSLYAGALMKQRRINEAEIQFREALKADPSHRFVGYFLAVELYAGQTFEQVAKLAAAYPERAPYGDGTPDWKKLIDRLESESGSYEGDYGKRLKSALDDFFDGKDSSEKADGLPALDAFVAALRKVS